LLSQKCFDEDGDVMCHLLRVAPGQDEVAEGQPRHGVGHQHDTRLRDRGPVRPEVLGEVLAGSALERLPPGGEERQQTADVIGEDRLEQRVAAGVPSCPSMAASAPAIQRAASRRASASARPSLDPNS
jgi:hypothetical protein